MTPKQRVKKKHPNAVVCYGNCATLIGQHCVIHLRGWNSAVRNGKGRNAREAWADADNRIRRSDDTNKEV